ncbi:hypothetical protein LCGC14_1484030 [marine sediment metagenome]|uniref:Uncharacterized protein n=1 Tax=marine sediment metagenome TaxID=412755 RepID=A0A0F9J999_9ZZZZ
MIRKDVVALWQVLNQLKNKEFDNFKFTYALAKNKRMLQSEIDTLQEVRQPSLAFQEYSQKRNEMLTRLSKKDEKGKPIIEDNLFVLENPDEASIEMEKFNEENKKVIDDNDIKEKNFKLLMDDEVEIKHYKVKLSNVPKKGLTPSQMEVLLVIIDEE